MNANESKDSEISRRSIIPDTPFFQAHKHSNKDAERQRSELIDAITNPNRQTAFALALILVLLILNFVLRFPDLGPIVAEFNQF
jgi:hypothetical protein